MWSHQLRLHGFREEMRTTHFLPHSLSFAECVANRRATTFQVPQWVRQLKDPSYPPVEETWTFVNTLISPSNPGPPTSSFPLLLLQRPLKIEED